MLADADNSLEPLLARSNQIRIPLYIRFLREDSDDSGAAVFEASEVVPADDGDGLGGCGGVAVPFDGADEHGADGDYCNGRGLSGDEGVGGEDGDVAAVRCELRRWRKGGLAERIGGKRGGDVRRRIPR